MDTILVFSLLFIYYSLSPKGNYVSLCLCGTTMFMTNLDGLNLVQGLFPFLSPESEKAVAKGELSRNHTVTTLQCSGLHSSIQVNLLYSERMYSVFTNKTNVKYTLQSLKVITDPDESVSTAHRYYQWGTCCLLYSSTSERMIFFSFLITGMGEDRLLRLTRRQSIYVKAVIICVLLPCALAFIVFVIFEVPFPVSLLSTIAPYDNLQRVFLSTAKYDLSLFHYYNKTCRVLSLRNPKDSDPKVNSVRSCL
uniref:Uncharacterized protein n=1 Tax=Chelonoidis abingdonii TaxID=106734 RepID=A0A8C0HDW5_CHEAB